MPPFWETPYVLYCFVMAKPCSNAINQSRGLERCRRRAAQAARLKLDDFPGWWLCIQNFSGPGDSRCSSLVSNIQYVGVLNFESSDFVECNVSIYILIYIYIYIHRCICCCQPTAYLFSSITLVLYRENKQTVTRPHEWFLTEFQTQEWDFREIRPLFLSLRLLECVVVFPPSYHFSSDFRDLSP